jgi:glycosyltransferase involved in cell wall biosynthesis
MKFSVLISNYNYRVYVGDAVRSVLAQSYAPSEIIVVDDGSSDDSLEYLRTHFGSVKNIRIVSTENRGQLAAMCEGYRYATGDLIALLDADDTWQPNYLERVAAKFEQASIDFVMVNIKFFGAQDGLWNQRTSDTDFGITSGMVSLAELPPWQGSPTSGLSLRRTLMDKALPPESFWGEWRVRADDCLVLGCAILGAHKYYIGEPLVNYRFHGSNNWAASKWSALGGAQYEIRKSRMLHYYCQRAYGSQRPSATILHFEFKSLPRPSLRKLFRYLGLLFKTRGGAVGKTGVGLMMMKYWWKQITER